MKKEPQHNNPISLPQGGGAISGIGETFQPNLFSGTGNFSIPIFTSPGRSGYQPQLSLQYSSGNGNGPFGMGWSLSIPRITRKTEKGLPRYDNKDVFVLSGAEDLVPILNDELSCSQDSYTITRYRPRTEGLFARIEAWSNADDPEQDHWRIITKDNITNIYGKSYSARVVDPEDSTKIYQWLLEEAFDAKGNHVLYEYAHDDSEIQTGNIFEQNRKYSQVYIRRILYGNAHDDLAANRRTGPERPGTDHLDPLATKNRAYLFEVLFDYFELPDSLCADSDLSRLESGYVPEVAPLRPDPFSSFRAGFELRTLRRCSRVLMLHHFDEEGVGNAPLIKSTDFTYSVNQDTRLSFLESVKVTGYRNGATASLPPVSFKYSEFAPQKQRYQSVKARGGDLPPRPLNDARFQLMDWFGNSLPDVMASDDNGYSLWENLGDGKLDRRHPLHGSVPSIHTSQSNVAIADMGGDGLVDLVVDAPPLSGFFEAAADGKWKPFKKFDKPPAFNLADPNLRLIDLTGDGLSDVLITRDHHFLWYRCMGEAGYGEPQAIPRQRNLNDFPDIYFNDPSGRVRLADMTGDGLNDIVLIHNGRVDYWPNMGYGRFGRRITMAHAPRLERDYDPKRLFLVDLDGSGCADMVYVGFTEVYFWFNQSGNGWSGQQIIHGTPYVVDQSAVQFADFFGTGTATLLWSYDYGAHPGSNYKALNFCGGVKPHLLIEMDNHMGATTRVQYGSSTRHYLEDKAAGRPWASNLPFPVQVVDKVEIIDHISKTKLVTTYKYHHGYYDGREREFRGFGRVDQFDTESFHAFTHSSLNGDAAFKNNAECFHVPAVETRRWFHTGIYFDENNPSASGEFYDHHDLMDAYRQEWYAGDGDAFDMGLNDANEPSYEAYRALRGSVLRTEIYAHDETDETMHPYLVTESRFRITRLQEHANHSHGVYLNSQKESISYHYERNPDDPRVTHQIFFPPDAYGNITKSVSIGYPRRAGSNRRSEQEAIHATCTLKDFINKDIDDYRYIGIEYQCRMYEVHGVQWSWGDAPLTEADFDQSDIKPYEWRPDGTEATRLIDWKRSYFRSDDGARVTDIDDNGNRTGSNRLDLGNIDRLGLPYESYLAAFTEALLRKVFDDGSGASRVSRNQLTEGGYYSEDGYWWIPSGQQSFTPEKFYLPENSVDPFGNTSALELDAYALLPVRATDAVGNRTKAEIDYRVLQPRKITDPNSHHSEVAFDALGMVVASAVQSEDGEDGDLLAGINTDLSAQALADYLADYLADPAAQAAQLLGMASTRIVYDLHAYENNPGKPVFASTLSRTIHARVDGVDQPPPEIICEIVYSDGFGREMQSKALADPGPIIEGGPHVSKRWVSSGSKVYNNKGKVVQAFEPFFSPSHVFGLEQHGISSTLFYDPMGRVICTIHPDHSYEKVVFDPWRQETWDGNDTIHLKPHTDDDVKGYTERFIASQGPLADYKSWLELAETAPDAAGQRAAAKTGKHADTPAVMHLDTLGRPYLAVADNGKDENGNRILYETRTRFDIEGNELSITDPRGIEAFTHGFDIAGRKMRIHSVDAGDKQTLPDVQGKLLYQWDANGNRVHHRYDALRRPVQTWVASAGAAEALAEHFIYGEASQAPPNAKGKLWKSYDGAGKVVNTDYDFKGNLKQSKRYLLSDGKKTDIRWPQTATHELDETAALTELDSTERDSTPYSVTTQYDALNRIIANRTPDGTGQTFSYNEAGLLDAVSVSHKRRQSDGSFAMEKESFVRNIDYDAHGRRTRIDYGNGVTTSYDYDRYTFRLTGMKSFRPGREDKPDLQHLSYTYDPVGNITEIRDDAHATVIHANQAVEPVNAYAYDPLYRLIQATGREHESMSACHYQKGDSKNTAFYAIPQPISNAQAIRTYMETYRYDDSGNFLELNHHGHWKRTQTYADTSNRILTSHAGCINESVIEHDDNGNITKLPHLPVMTWDYRNQLIEVQANEAANPDKAYYQYDAAGQRVRKTVVKGGMTEERIYIGGYELFVRRGTNALRRETVHVMDDKNRIALIERTLETASSIRNVKSSRARYQLANHLGSASLEVGDSADAKLISYEEYYPYGGTSYIAHPSGADNKIVASRKRYRYSGKERDDETGMYYYGARYYAPWLGRWVSADPVGKRDGFNLFVFVRGNPVSSIDSVGHQTEDRWLYQHSHAVNGTTMHYQSTDTSTLTVSSETEDKEQRRSEAAAEEHQIAAKIVKYWSEWQLPSVSRLNEKEKQDIFRESATKTLSIIAYEFATGSGREERIFTEDHAIVRQLHQSETVKNALSKYYAGDLKNGHGAYQFSPSLDFDPLSSLIEHGVAVNGIIHSDWSNFFLGGVAYSVNELPNGSIAVSLSDVKSLNSLALHIAESTQYFQGIPLGTTRQQYNLIISPKEAHKIMRDKLQETTIQHYTKDVTQRDGLY